MLTLVKVLNSMMRLTVHFTVNLRVLFYQYFPFMKCFYFVSYCFCVASFCLPGKINGVKMEQMKIEMEKIKMQELVFLRILFLYVISYLFQYFFESL